MTGREFKIQNPKFKIGEDNCAVLMTGAGAAAIAVVRLRGPLTAAFIREHIEGKVPAGRAAHARLHVKGEVVDDPIVFVADGFTEIHLHGGPWIVQRVMELLCEFGFEVRGEFTPDAEVADGAHVIEREIEAWLPMARTELAIETLLGQKEAWEKLERSPFLSDEMLGDQSLYWLLNPPRVAIVGVANSGKSTLANRLFGQERSIVADLPGTTRDWVGEYANIEGLAVMLVDTPGIRDTEDAIEAMAIEQSRGEIAEAQRAVFVLDRTQELARQRQLLEKFPNAIVVANKADCAEGWNDAMGISISARSGEGVEQLRRVILRAFGVGRRGNDTARWWTPRQRELLQKGPC